MIYDNGNTIEILDEQFPAVNIQIWNGDLNLHYDAAHDIRYGLYFEMMFETGYNLTVSQELANWLNGVPDKCTNIQKDHFIVEVTHHKDFERILEVRHCQGEEDLCENLKGMQKIYSDPVYYAYSALAKC